MSAVQLSLCMIVRDSAQTLPDCLASICPWVDEMIVVDTGSVDETPEIVHRHGGKLFHFEWCDDFAAARNESLRHASGEWLFWMDSDDTIDRENGRRLRALADGPHNPATLGYVMQVHCPGGDGLGDLDATAVDHVKMFRNHRGIAFECRIHEQVLMAIRRLGGEVAWTDIHVMHSGADQSPEGRRRKQQRDMRLLELELADRPDHPFALFNVGMTYSDMGEYERGAEYLARSLQVAGVQESHVAKAYALLVHCLSQQDKVDDALARCDEGLRHYPQDAELLFRRGILAHRLGRYSEAVDAFRGAMAQRELRKMSSVDRGISGFKARHNLALVYRDMERLDLAELQWREALADVPQFRSAWHGLGEVLLQQDRVATASVELGRLERQVGLEADAEVLRARIQQANGGQEQARLILDAAFRKFPDDDGVCEAYSRLLFEMSQWDAAVMVLECLTELQPENGAAFHNLGAAWMNLGYPERATTALNRSLELRPQSPTTRVLLTQATRLLTSAEN